MKIIIFTLLFLLTACPNVKQSLRVDNPAPDEFRVITQKPLDTPTDFFLQVPQLESDNPQKNTDEVVSILTQSRAESSRGETQLIHSLLLPPKLDKEFQSDTGISVLVDR